jgi:hypothetical protein
MTATARTTVTASVLLFACLAASTLLLRQVDRMRTDVRSEEILYLDSPKAVRWLSLGYTGLMADVYWTRAVQYFGWKHHAQAAEYKLLAPLLEMTTALDPHLLVAYQFGANFLAPKPPFGAGETDRAIALVEYGIRNNPNDWNLYYQLGFIYYMDKKDYPSATRALSEGAKLPGAHIYLKVLAAQIAQHAGELQMSRLMWATTYESTKDKSIRTTAAYHLRALDVEEDVLNLQNAVTAYGQKTGALPSNMQALIGAGFLRGVPIDPNGKPYKMMADGRIEVSDPDDFPFLERGLPPGYTPNWKPDR